MRLLKKKIDLNTFILIDKIDDDVLINNLLNEVYSIEKNQWMTTDTNVIAKHSQFSSLINSRNFHIFLKKIKYQMLNVYKFDFNINEVWANIYNKKDDHALPHNHLGATAFCGILYLTDGPGPGTYFEDYNETIFEEKGKFVLFDSHLKHSVSKFNYTKDRVTIAWNFTRLSPWILKANEHFNVNDI